MTDRTKSTLALAAIGLAWVAWVGWLLGYAVRKRTETR